MSRSRVLSVLSEVVDDLKQDYLSSKGDELVRLRDQVLRSYYEVKSIAVPSEPLGVGFVDAGFRPYRTDVSFIIPMKIGALLRDPDGRILTVHDVLGKPPVENVVLYSSRRPSGEAYEFRVKVRSASDGSLLFEERGGDLIATQEINRFVRDFVRPSLKREPGFFSKFTRYIEGLIELAYAVKLLHSVRGAGLKLKYATLDGTLIKWFAVERAGGAQVDGLNIVSALSGLDVDTVKSTLWSVVGLSKTTKFINLARSYGLFRCSKGAPGGLYATPSLSGTEIASRILTEQLSEPKRRGLVKEIVRTVNRVVYDKNGVYVSRFPVTPDGRNVFVLDLHIPEPILSVGDSVRYNVRVAEHARRVLDEVVAELFRVRSKIVGEPPYGYMEVDRLVRFGGEESAAFEDTLISLVRSTLEDELASALVQAFSPTTRMRYGYR